MELLEVACVSTVSYPNMLYSIWEPTCVVPKLSNARRGRRSDSWHVETLGFLY